MLKYIFWWGRWAATAARAMGRGVAAAAVRGARRTYQKVTVVAGKALHAMGSGVKRLYEVVSSWLLYKNTLATDANTAATAENTMAMAAEGTSAVGQTAASKLSSIIKRAWAVVKKPFACVGSAYAGYLIYTLLFHEQPGLVDMILSVLTIALGVYTGVAVVGAVATGLCVMVGAATGWCIDRYHSCQTTSRRSRTEINLNIHLHEHQHVHHYRLHIS